MKRVRLSKISALHMFKLVFRSLLLLWAVLTYFLNEPLHHMTFSEMAPEYQVLLWAVWAVFAMEMALRFFPSRFESMGCQKQFSENYRAIAGAKPVGVRDVSRGVIWVLASWLVLNGALAVLYCLHILTDGWLLMIALFYSVSDMICILFFCPFQTLMMHNRCCATCRIYNWDYLMMFTPLLFVRSLYTWSLAGMALLLFIRWEVTVHRYPERFSNQCNRALTCAMCEEKLCHHKTQLHSLWKTQRLRLERLTEQQRARLEKLTEQQRVRLERLAEAQRQKLEKMAAKQKARLDKQRERLEQLTRRK